MAISLQKELYLSVFPHTAIIKIDNIWRICKGQYINNGSGYSDMFVTPIAGGQTVAITYPDFKIYDFLNGDEGPLYQTVCDYNISQLSQEIMKKKRIVAAKDGCNNTVRAETRQNDEDALNQAIRRFRETANEIRRAQAEVEHIIPTPQGPANNLYYTADYHTYDCGYPI